MHDWSRLAFDPSMYKTRDATVSSASCLVSQLPDLNKTVFALCKEFRLQSLWYFTSLKWNPMFPILANIGPSFNTRAASLTLISALSNSQFISGCSLPLIFLRNLLQKIDFGSKTPVDVVFCSGALLLRTTEGEGFDWDVSCLWADPDMAVKPL